MLFNMKISIISITFNNYEELIKTLRSIPEDPRVEIVVINGGGCEQTKDFLENNSEIVSVSEPDKGIADAFNKGFDLASGDLFLFLNSGDILIEKRYIDWLLKQNEGDFFYAGILFDDYEYGIVPIYPHNRNIGYGMPYPHQTLAVKRYVVEKIGNFNLSYSIAMDYEFTCRMIKAGFCGKQFDGGPVVLMDGAGVSRVKELQSIKDALRALWSSKLIYRPFISVTFVLRCLRILARKIMEFFGLRSLVKKYKISKAQRALKRKR
tara:strand:+ start:53441 stop:54235 length:795 start_codon:yes stop_codon:yes gene_type:complete